MKPVIRFTILFGLLAVELPKNTSTLLAAVFGFVISAFFVWRSFYAMRIGEQG